MGEHEVVRIGFFAAVILALLCICILQAFHQLKLLDDRSELRTRVALEHASALLWKDRANFAGWDLPPEIAYAQRVGATEFGVSQAYGVVPLNPKTPQNVLGDDLDAALPDAETMEIEMAQISKALIDMSELIIEQCTFASNPDESPPLYPRGPMQPDSTREAVL